MEERQVGRGLSILYPAYPGEHQRDPALPVEATPHLSQGWDGAPYSYPLGGLVLSVLVSSRGTRSISDAETGPPRLTESERSTLKGQQG